MDLVNKQINSLYWLNDDSLQGFNDSIETIYL